MSRCDKITDKVIGAAIEVHRTLGPGLLESAYESCLVHELMPLGVSVRRQVEIPVRYKGHLIECGYRIDLIVEELVVVELKSVEKKMPIHEAQLLTYLRLANLPVGLLINFNVTQLINGLNRRINNISSP
ncbi:MAG: GxxExxY protein [Phycisphaeraceae bacterium]|nr:GxxExxY protein [Phycisphaeraceae bacterium]